MALLHRADLRPTKLALLAGWLPDRPWYAGPAAPTVARVAGYRFDDPAGAVGIETLLVSAGDGPIYQVPLTYRDTPLAGGDEWLIGTAEHSVLGRRWVYDGCGDPVHAAALANAILAGGAQAEELIDVDGRLERREPSMHITGGASADAPVVGAIRRVVEDDPTLIVTDTVELAVVRRLALGAEASGAGAGADRGGAQLTGTWNGQPDPQPLAYAALRA